VGRQFLGGWIFCRVGRAGRRRGCKEIYKGAAEIGPCSDHASQPEAPGFSPERGSLITVPNLAFADGIELFRWDWNKPVNEGGNWLSKDIVRSNDIDVQGSLLYLKPDCPFHAKSSVFEAKMEMQGYDTMDISKVGSGLFIYDTQQHRNIYPYWSSDGVVVEACTDELYAPLSVIESCPRLPYYTRKNIDIAYKAYQNLYYNFPPYMPNFEGVKLDIKERIYLYGPVAMGFRKNRCGDH